MTRRSLEVIPLERIEAEADAVRCELDRLLERARDEYRALQDAEVDVEAGSDVGRLWSRLYVARDELAGIARQLTRAQASLVHPKDSRAAAARQVIGYCDEADELANRRRAA
jgi:hypothetical protein